MKKTSFLRMPVTAWLKTSCSVLTLTACLAAGGAQAADKGSRNHAKGQYDAVTLTYGVVEGDELVAISERFEIPVDALKAQNKLPSSEVKVGQKLVVTAGTPAGAPEITGVLGSPSATTTLDGKQLPPPDPTFGGVIKEKASESKPWWAPRVVPPKGAPNVLLIMTDDSGLARRAPSAASFRPRPWIVSPRPGCATRISTPRRCARPRGRRSSPAATITWPASGWWAKSRRGFRATTRSSGRRTAPSAPS